MLVGEFFVVEKYDHQQTLFIPVNHSDGRTDCCFVPLERLSLLLIDKSTPFNPQLHGFNHLTLSWLRCVCLQLDDSSFENTRPSAYNKLDGKILRLSKDFIKSPPGSFKLQGSNSLYLLYEE